MTKLEEIALAIHRARYPDAAVMDGIEGISPTVAAQALVEARAAVEVMRDYSEIQSQTGGAVPRHQFGDELDRVGCSIAERCWLAMIDAILNEKPGA